MAIQPIDVARESDVDAEADAETILDQLPADVRTEILDLEPELLNDLREGRTEEIPADIVEQLPPGVADRIPDSLIASAGENPGLAAALIVVGILCILAAVWGAVKGFFKMAILLGVVGAGAWFWYLS